ncbi:MAG TPA: PAS domain S-box protein [Brumimicrobium sp.]|nr:PAS domain S-box protein [Brumimicrobium sp.]
MKLKKHIVLFSMLFLLPYLVKGQVYTFKNYGHEEGLNLSALLTIQESQDGYLWFGTDGGGLVRFDGKSFNYLENEQGRNNRHVNHILFKNNRLLFTTLYRGVFEFKDGVIKKLDYVSQVGRNHAIIDYENNNIILQDGGLRLYKDSILIDEKITYPYNTHTYFYGSFSFSNNLLIFSSKGNTIVHDNRIHNLNEWLVTDESVTNDLIASFKTGDSLVLIDKYLDNEITVLMEDNRPKFFIKEVLNNNLLNSGEHVIRWDSRNDDIVFLTNQGNIIKRSIINHSYKKISRNSSVNILNPSDILIDRNQDIWVTTRTNGVYRISLEPFTVISSHPIFQSPMISFIGETKNNDVIVSIGNEGTFIRSGGKDAVFVKNEKIDVTSFTHIDSFALVSTNNGVLKVNEGRLETYEPLADLNGERMTLVTNAFGYVWYAIESKGLFRRDLNSGEEVHYSSAPAYFYNVISTRDSSELYFGTNYGVYRYSRDSDVLSQLSNKVDGEELGSYVGNSTIDTYGTKWFSFDNGLYGVTKNNEKVAITNEVHLPSLLIYTLNSDDFGNLLVGSNKGVTVVKVDAHGKPLASKTYNKNNGFYGYETHMRASHKRADGSIYLGTLEGLIMVKPEYLKKTHSPNRPIVFSFKNKNVDNLITYNDPIVLKTEDNNLLIEFSSVNTKSNYIAYSYKLEGLNDNWTDWSKDQQAFYSNLKSGKYIFKVRASIDGESISEITSMSFKVHIPFYKNKWFIISVITLLIVINIYILDRTRNFNRNNIILSRDLGADKKMASNMLAFGAFINTASHLFAPRIDTTIAYHDASAIIIGVIMFSLFLIVTFVDRAKKKTGFYLVAGFLILLGYNLLFVYLSDIHPFYFIVLLLVVFVAPFILKRLRSAVFLSLALIVLSIVIMFFVHESLYNQYLFLLGISIIGFLTVFMTYLRNNSLEHLIFTSGIVNNGNALVIAFDIKGEISYASENTEILLGLKKELKGRSISFLNEFLLDNNESSRFSSVDLVSQFKEGAIFVTPLITVNNEVVYYQWSCKEFSENVRVILGQDVTEKINLENYYELIVRNADDLIFQTDTHGNFTFVNEKCEAVFGMSKAELLNTSVFSLVKPSLQMKVRNFFANSLKERNKGVYLEFPIVSSNDGLKWMGLNLTTMQKPAAENVVIGFLGLARNITEAIQSNAIIKDQNKDITASINYARRIQFNMLPRSADFENLFEEHFILYRPKDIVSGDFYWLKKIENKTILIVSDSTGHGVPGSFMTLLGINILNQIILEAKITDPGEILNQLDSRLMEVLPRDGRNRIQDGMETVVCVFDDNSDSLEYALAGGRFVVTDTFRDKLKVVKGQIKHIGDAPQNDDFKYETLKMTLTTQQSLYIFTDGYPDQFGGENNKKLTIRKFLSLLDAISPQHLHDQNVMLQEHLFEWIADHPQTDDITVIGVRGKKG